jgi:hypothetical protein
MRALFASWTSRRLFLVLIQRVEEVEKQLRKGQGFGMIVWPVRVSEDRQWMTGHSVGIDANYVASSSSLVKPTDPYCISSSRSASASGDLALWWPLIVRQVDFMINREEQEEMLQLFHALRCQEE